MPEPKRVYVSFANVTTLQQYKDAINTFYEGLAWPDAKPGTTSEADWERSFGEFMAERAKHQPQPRGT